MVDGVEAVALETVENLEGRLRKIEYVLTGESSDVDTRKRLTHSGSPSQTVFHRLAQLERGLERLRSGSKVIGSILQLYARHPDWFEPSRPDEVPSLLSDDEMLATVFAMADLMPRTLSQLIAVSETAVPPAEQSMALVQLEPRIERLRSVQQDQARELAHLRLRSALVLERWYEATVLGAGECWADWDTRVGLVEGRLARLQSTRERERREAEMS